MTGLYPAVFLDPFTGALPMIVPDWPWFSFTAHNLYVLALLLTEPHVVGFRWGTFALPGSISSRGRGRQTTTYRSASS